jgi:hypothetical protein
MILALLIFNIGFRLYIASKKRLLHVHEIVYNLGVLFLSMGHWTGIGLPFASQPREPGRWWTLHTQIGG